MPRIAPSLRVETVANIYGCAADPVAAQRFGQVIHLRKEGCDFNRLPVYQFDFVGLHHLIYVSIDGRPPMLAAGASGITLGECDAVNMGFPAQEGMREVQSKALLAIVSRLVDEHRATKVPLGYAGGYTILKPFRRDREVLGSIIEVLAALVADDFLASRLQRLLTFGFVGRSARFITRLGFSVVVDEDTGKGSFPAPYLPGSFASFFEMTEPSHWALDCRARWASILGDERQVIGVEARRQAEPRTRSA